MKSKTNKISSYIAIFILLLLVIGITFVLIQGINGDLIGGLKVKINGKAVGNGTELILKIDEPIEFTVENVLGSKLEGYSVSITPYISKENDFDCIVGRDVYRFSELKDLSKGFDVTIDGEKIRLNNTLEMESILAVVLGGDVVLSRDVNFYAIPFVKINITYGKDTISYPIKLGGYPQRIIFDKEVILF